MPDQNYNTGNGLTPVGEQSDPPKRKLTDEEAEAILTLVRGGWLKFEMVDHR